MAARTRSRRGIDRGTGLADRPRPDRSKPHRYERIARALDGHPPAARIGVRLTIEEAVARGPKEDQSTRTRAALIDAARALFAERGYAATGTEDIVHAAGVTRGALYHHFVDKQDLFEAVYTNLQNDLRERIRSAARADEDASVWERIRRGVHEYLDHSMEPTVQRIVLVEAPAVFGWERWREIDSEYALGLLKGAMIGARDEGLLIDADPDTLAHLMLGVLSEASQVIAGADNIAAARLEVGTYVNHLLDSLRASS